MVVVVEVPAGFQFVLWSYLNENAPSQTQYPHQCTPPFQQLLHPIVSEHKWKQAILTVHTGSDTLLGLLVTHVFHYLLDHFGLGWKFHLNPFFFAQNLASFLWLWNASISTGQYCFAPEDKMGGDFASKDKGALS